MFKKLNLIAFIFLTLCSTTSAQMPFTLDDAIAYALGNSRTMQLEKLNIADAEGQIDEYTSIGIPKIIGSVNYQHFFDIPTSIFPDFLSPAIYGVLFEEELLEERPLETGPGLPTQFGTKDNLDAGIEMNTLLLDGSYFIGLRAQKMYRELVAKQVKAKTHGIKSDVIKKYLSVVIIDENIERLKDNINNLTALRNETNEIYKSGFAEKLDVDRLELSLHNLQSEKESLQRLSEISRYALKFTMGFPLEKEIELLDHFNVLKDELMMEKIDELPIVDYHLRPEYDALNTSVEIQDLNIKRLKISYLPSLVGFAGIKWSLQRQDLFDSNDNDWFRSSFAGAGLQVPIFDGFERKAQIQRAKVQKEKTLVQKSIFEESMQLEVNSYYLSLMNARTRVENAEKGLALAQEIYDITQIKFREGIGSSVEVTQAEAELYNSQANYTSAVYEFIVAKMDLKTALGKI